MQEEQLFCLFSVKAQLLEIKLAQGFCLKRCIPCSLEAGPQLGMAWHPS